MFGRIGLPEIILILLIVLLLFGARKLPEIGKGIGEGIKNFKKAISGSSSKEEKEENKSLSNSNEQENK
ncbi:MAG: twin-arginine translocase TatA/TatE family subunit [Acidobacteriota bacterium]